MTHRLRRLLPDVRGEERGRVAVFFVLAALVNLAQTVGLAGSEAILLGRLGAGVLPVVFVLASAVTVVATLVYAAVVGRARNDLLFVGMLVLAGIAILAGSLGARAGWSWIPPALLCAYFASQAVFLNHFLTFAGDYFDTLASKRVVPLFTVGGSLGGALGGATAVVASRIATAEILIAAWALLLGASAIWLLALRSPLNRWRALGFEEADETSVQGMLASVRHARRSSLSRWLVASILAMVIALFVSQYLYSEIFARRFGTTQALATFLGIYLAASNLLEIGIELLLTPLLIRRFGVATANLIHGSLTVASFGVLAVDFRLSGAIVARLNREMLDNALAQPVRSLVYNALPLRLRGRMRAFAEGIVLYSGMSLAGAFLLVAGRPDPLWLCGLGAAAAGLYLAASLRVRSAYLDALMEQLQAGRLDLGALGAELGRADFARLAELWSELLRSDAAAAASAAELAPLLAGRDLVDPLIEASAHPDPGVRLACVEALATTGNPAAQPALLRALEDGDPAVRLAALRALGAALDSPSLERRCEDADPRVRALAASRLEESGAAVLEAMARSHRVDEAVAALELLPPPLWKTAALRLDDPEALVRAAAIASLARANDPQTLSPERLERALRDPDAAVRREAVRAADALLGSEACGPLARCLDDPSREIRTLAGVALGRRGDAGVEAAASQLRGGPWTVDAALAVLGRAGTPRARARLQAELGSRVAQAWENLLALHGLSGERGIAGRFLRAAHGDALLRSVRLAFRVLRQLEGSEIVGHVERALRLGSSRERADALEVLSNLADRTSSTRLALLLEAGPLEERLRALGGLDSLPRTAAAVLRRARHSADPWVRMAAVEALEGTSPEGEVTMERLLALRQIRLFSQLSLDQLESVNRAMKVEQYARGEVVVREGERGNRLFLLLEGEIEIFADHGTRDQVLLNRLRPVTSFGEMAVLYDETRTATAVTSEDSLLASLDGERMKELILRMPEISFEIFRELIERSRAAEERLKRYVHGEAP